MASSSPQSATLPKSRASQESASDELLADLVVANHILFDQGIVDGFGHVSVRHNQDPDKFLLARNMAPGQVTLNDILEFDLDGAPLNADGRPVYLERFIHSEIYRARPDAKAIVHSHSHSIVPLSISKTARLRAVFHMAGFIGEEAPLFEIRDTAGPATDLLISSPGLGRALAECCGSHNIVLMRGHGSTVIGGSIRQVIYRAVYAELNARYQVRGDGPWRSRLSDERGGRDHGAHRRRAVEPSVEPTEGTGHPTVPEGLSRMAAPLKERCRFVLRRELATRRELSRRDARNVVDDNR
jgi:HCOMODA/2-hydroxy-3-carboxy-muconic semialdehyde decarboxylase